MLPAIRTGDFYLGYTKLLNMLGRCNEAIFVGNMVEVMEYSHCSKVTIQLSEGATASQHHSFSLVEDLEYASDDIYMDAFREIDSIENVNGILEYSEDDPMDYI